MDGVGEMGDDQHGRRSGIVSLNEEIHFPHPLGLLYSAFTYYTGFQVNSGEYKVMASRLWRAEVRGCEHATT